MPSFDIVSKVDMHEVTNAVDQANREVSTRFDFKDTGATFVLGAENITLKAQNSFQLQQMLLVLKNKLSKRKVDIKSLTISEPEESLHEAKQVLTIRQGIDQNHAKKIVKMIKDSKLKVQAAIQGEQIRITGKKRDDLQQVIALLRDKDMDLALQFENFRD